MDSYQNDSPYYPEPSNGTAVAALVFGLIGIMTSFFSILMPLGIVSLVCSIVGIVLGGVGHKKSRYCGRGGGLAIAGLVLGIVGVVFAITGLACAAGLCAAGAFDPYSGIFGNYSNF